MIPEKIKIGGIVYSVRVSSETLVLDGKECSGIIDYDNAIIKINNNRSEQKMLQTFWHEVFHGIIRERNFCPKDVDEETLVDEMAIALHQIIIDNPNLFINMPTTRL